jgi:two-component system, cell cycle sensor histidine kinase and response regulator CckA
MTGTMAGMNETGQNEVQEVSPAAGIRVLVVDDDTCIFDVFREMFPAPKYEASFAPNGQVALTLAARQPFDLAFVDFYMVGMNGVEVSQKLHQVQPQIKIVLMSGYLVDERAAMIEQAGARSFLTKPFRMDAAQALAERLCAEKR